jgi:uncharacterized Zn-binding protein involved in type VI secretion
MPPAIRKTLDSAGGILLEGSPNVFVNGRALARIGDAVQGHAPGEHASPVMAQGSATVRVNGIPPCRRGDLATCGHPAEPGSPDTNIGGAPTTSW